MHRKWFEKCECELRKTATQPVPGDGSAEAEIVFIGEAPGRSENEQGNLLWELRENFWLKCFRSLI